MSYTLFNTKWIYPLMFLSNAFEILGVEKEEWTELDGDEGETHGKNTNASAPKTEISDELRTWYEFVPRRNRSPRDVLKNTDWFGEHSPSMGKMDPKMSLDNGEGVLQKGMEKGEDEDAEVAERINNRCGICRITFRFDTHYARHCGEAHGITRPFECEYCRRKFANKSTVKRHRARKHRNFIRDPIFIGKRITHERRKYCEICKITLGNVRNYEKHVLSKHEGVKMMRCSKCPKKYSRWTTLLNHEREKHYERRDNVQFKCEFCLNVFERTDVLEEHRGFCQRRQLEKRNGNIVRNVVKANLANVRFRCDVKGCQRDFQSYLMLTNHYKGEHPEVKLHPCVYCGEAFRVKHFLNRHLDKHHADKVADLKGGKYRKGNVYTCRYCGGKFEGMKAYGRHAKEHPGQPMYFCEECGEGYVYHDSLYNHANDCHGDFGLKKRCRYCPRHYFKRGHFEEHEIACRKLKEKKEKFMEEGRCYYCKLCAKFLCMPYTTFRYHVRRHRDCDYCKFCDNTAFNRYRNPNGLKNHTQSRHPSSDKIGGEGIVEIGAEDGMD